MAVGENEPIRREDDAGAAAPSDFDADDGGSDLFDGADDRLGIRVQQVDVIVGGIGDGSVRHGATVTIRQAPAHHPDR